MLKMSKNRAILHAQMCSGERVAAVGDSRPLKGSSMYCDHVRRGRLSDSGQHIKVQHCEFKVILQACVYWKSTWETQMGTSVQPSRATKYFHAIDGWKWAGASKIGRVCTCTVPKITTLVYLIVPRTSYTAS